MSNVQIQFSGVLGITNWNGVTAKELKSFVDWINDEESNNVYKITLEDNTIIFLRKEAISYITIISI